MNKYDFFDFDVVRGWVNQKVASFSKGKIFDYPPPPYFSKEYPAKGKDQIHMDQFWKKYIESAINKYWEANGDPPNEARLPGVWDFPYK